MQRAQAALDGVSSVDIPRITSGALHLDFDPIGCSQFKVSLDNWSCEVVDFFEHVPLAIIKVSLLMPRRVSAAARSAENEELRIRRPLHFLNVTTMFAIRGFEVLSRQDRAFHVADLDSRFIERRVGMSSNRQHTGPQLLIWRRYTWAFNRTGRRRTLGCGLLSTTEN